MSHEFYDILGVAREASADEIKKAYRKKAMELHPDRHGGDKAKEAEFKKLNEAYSTLSDPTKKANYDRFGTAEGMGGGFGGGFQGGFDGISAIFFLRFSGEDSAVATDENAPKLATISKSSSKYHSKM